MPQDVSPGEPGTNANAVGNHPNQPEPGSTQSMDYLHTKPYLFANLDSSNSQPALAGLFLALVVYPGLRSGLLSAVPTRLSAQVEFSRRH